MSGSDIFRYKKARDLVKKLWKTGKKKSEIVKALKGEITHPVVYKVIKDLENGGSGDWQKMGRKRTVRTKKLRNSVDCKLRRNPNRSISGLARDSGVSRRTMQRLIHEDLGMKSLVKSKRQFLSAETRQKRISETVKLAEINVKANHPK